MYDTFFVITYVKLNGKGVYFALGASHFDKHYKYLEFQGKQNVKVYTYI